MLRGFKLKLGVRFLELNKGAEPKSCVCYLYLLHSRRYPVRPELTPGVVYAVQYRVAG